MSDSIRPLTVSVHDSATMLGVTERTVRRWLDSGLLSYSQPAGPGGRVLVSVASLQALADAKPARSAASSKGK